MGGIFGSVSYLSITASDLSDQLLKDFLDMDSSQIVTMHVQSVDQNKAIKNVKRTITELDRSTIEEQKKAIRAGYDMEILPSDLKTYGRDAKALLKELQSQNEQMFLVTDDDIIVCDPEAEYAPLVERLHGQVTRISPASTRYINPLDINSNYSEEDNPLALKADFILSLCELVVGGKEGLLPVEKTVIDRCVHLIYRKYFADPAPENMPLLKDLYNALLQQDEKEAHHVAAALEIYVKGSLNVFNHRTNVDINNCIVCFDIKQLGKQLKKLGMLIVQDAVWGRVTANRSAGKSTRYYVDEFHLLLKEAQTAAYSIEIWKRFRKWGGLPTAITQNVKDLLASPEVSNFFENSDFVYMLNQANGDRQILAKQLNISPHQLSYVIHSGEGEGLLFYGNTILPFIDRFPHDLELYKIMTTRLSEVSEEDKS